MKRFKAILILTAAAALLALHGHAQQKGEAQEPLPPEQTESLPSANDALALALADSQLYSAYDRYFMRYIWVWNGDVEEAQAASHAINIISCASLVRPNMARNDSAGVGKLILLRVDLRWFAPKAKDLQRWVHLWEEFRYDSKLTGLLTADMIKFALEAGAPHDLKFGRHWWGERGLEKGSITLGEASEYSVLRVLRSDIDPVLLGKAQETFSTIAPIVSHDYFVARVLASIRDSKLFDGLYDTLYGGLYYEFAGVPDTLEALLNQVGAGDFEKGKLTTEQIFDRIGGDKRVACFRSKIAGGRPRRIDFIPLRASDTYESRRFISVTHDVKRANLDTGANAVMNLLKFGSDDANEVIWTRPNGMLGYALFNGTKQGKRQEKVPDDIANDSTVPEPYSRELQSGISCMACHEAKPNDGWQPVENDVQKLLAKRFPRLDVFDDLNGRREDRQETLDRLAGLYAGDSEMLLKSARTDYSRTVLKATGPWKDGKDQLDVVRRSSGKLVEMWRRFFYKDVTPQVALAELGWRVPEKMSQRVFDALTPPAITLNTNATTQFGYVGGQLGFVPVSPRLFALKQGIPLSRFDWDQESGLTAALVQQTLKANPEFLKEQKR